MKKYILITLIFATSLFSMPEEIQDYKEQIITTPTASWLKDIMSPAKDVHADGEKIYTEEIEDIKVNIKIEKQRVINSMHINFLTEKNIDLLDSLINQTYVNRAINNSDILKNITPRKEEKKDEN